MRAIYYRIIQLLAFLCRGGVLSDLITGGLARVRMLADSMGACARRRIYLGHLDRIFPEQGDAWKKRTMLEFWKKHERGILGLFIAGRLGPADLPGRLEWDGRELLDHALEERRGVLLLAPHFGDERMMHILLAMSGYPIHVISSAYEQAAPVVRKARLRISQRWHHVGFPGESMRWLYGALHGGEIVQIAPTAYAGPRGLWVRSFGVPVLATSTPFRLQRATGCAMLLGYCHAMEGYRYRIALRPFEPETGISMSEDAQRLFDSIERYAKQHPGQYDWMNLVIRHRETNTISRTGAVPVREEELASAAIPEDSDPSTISGQRIDASEPQQD